MSATPSPTVASPSVSGAMPSRVATARYAIAALAFATVSWGAAFPVAKFVLDYVDPLTMALLRYGPAATIFLIILAVKEGSQALRTEGAAWKLLALGSLGFGGFNLLMFYGVIMSRPEFGAIVMALQPLIVTAIHAVRTRSRPGVATLVSLLVAVLGVMLLTTNGDLARLTQHAAVIPTLMMIAGGTCWVLYSMGASTFPEWSALRYTALTSSGGTVSLAVMWLLVRTFGGIRLPSASAVPNLLPAIVFLFLIAAVLAVLAWNQGLRSLGAQRGMLFINIVPLTALLVGVLRGHPLGQWELLGAGLVLMSLFLNQVGGLKVEVTDEKQTRNGEQVCLSRS